MEIVGDGDSAAQSVPRIDREAHVAASVNHGEPRVVRATHLGVVHREARLGLDVPVDAVVAERETDVRPLELLLLVGTVVVAEDHDVFAVEFRHAGVENERRLVWNIL